MTKRCPPKTRQANGDLPMRTRQRQEQQHTAARQRVAERDPAVVARMEATKATVRAQKGLSAKVTTAAHRAWAALRSPGSYADALVFLATKIRRIVGRITASIVDGLIWRWARVTGFAGA